MKPANNHIKLRQVLNKKLDRWNERSLFTIGGVKGLTRADIDTLLMCCDWYEQNGNLNGLAYFSQEVRCVLEKYEMMGGRCRNEVHS